MKVVVALGSNLGDSQLILDEAISSLQELLGDLKVSSFYRTAPVGGPEQPDYLNAVAIGDTALEPLDLLDQLQAIEAQAGRVRDIRWGPRTLDLDLITYGELELESERLTLPHPRAHERGFVLQPWSEIDPSALLPGQGAIADLLANLGV